MKKHNPVVMMPDRDTEVLTYHGDDFGYTVSMFNGSNWVEAWNEDVIGAEVVYWIDLDDLKKVLK